MELALREPQRVAALVAADIAPVAYPASHGTEFAALTAVDQARCRSRSEAGEIMAQQLEGEMVIQFLLKSLARGADGIYGWRFNLAALKAGYGEIRAAIAPGTPYRRPVLFVKGGESTYIEDRHREDLTRPRLQYQQRRLQRAALPREMGKPLHDRLQPRENDLLRD